MTSALRSFQEAPVRHLQLGGTNLAYRVFGQGPALVWVHGWPLCGATYRDLVAKLSANYTCYVPDLPGAGQTPWVPSMGETFAGFSALISDLVQALDLDRVALVGHDSGGSVARLAATKLGDRVRALVLFNTELPNHLPWLVRLISALVVLPGSDWIFKQLLRQRWYRHSPFGFGGAFHDPRLLDGEFHEVCVAPVLEAPRPFLAAMRAADFRVLHPFLKPAVPTLCIWGAADPFFPLNRARAMVATWPTARLEVVAKAKLLVYEEAPELALAWMSPFLRSHLS